MQCKISSSKHKQHSMNIRKGLKFYKLKLVKDWEGCNKKFREQRAMEIKILRLTIPYGRLQNQSTRLKWAWLISIEKTCQSLMDKFLMDNRRTIAYIAGTLNSYSLWFGVWKAKTNCCDNLKPTFVMLSKPIKILSTYKSDLLKALKIFHTRERKNVFHWEIICWERKLRDESRELFHEGKLSMLILIVFLVSSVFWENKWRNEAENVLSSPSICLQYLL